MAPVTCLEIIDWRKEADIVNVSKPEVLSCFTKDWHGSEYYSDTTYVKMFDSNAELDVNKLRAKFNKCSIELPVNELKEPIDEFKRWRSKNETAVKVFDPHFVTNRNTLCSIMNSPFEVLGEKGEWTILAKIEGDVINLELENNTVLTKTLNKHYDQLKRYLFINRPKKLSRKTTSLFYQNIYDVMQINVGAYRVLYSAECPGILNSNEDEMNFEKFSKAERIFSDIFEIGEFMNDILNYNPIWWSKANLSNASLGYIGVLNSEEDRLRQIMKFNIHSYIDTTKYENLWSPDAAWNFLDVFLSFVLGEFAHIKSKYRSKCLLKFTKNENNKEVISCEPLLEQVINGTKCYVPLLEVSPECP